MAMIAVSGYAQTVSYIHKPWKEDGCTVTFSVSAQDTAYYIVVSVAPGDFKFLSSPTMKLKTTSGEVIKLKGVSLGDETATSYRKDGDEVIASKLTTMAMFAATPEQFEKMKGGVAKVRLSTIPFAHERTFDVDKIGKALYDLYVKERDAEENF